MFPALYATPPTAGGLAQWDEMLLDPDTKIARPRQIYTGAHKRDYTPREHRT
jgi:citrate synthase